MIVRTVVRGLIAGYLGGPQFYPFFYSSDKWWGIFGDIFRSSKTDSIPKKPYIESNRGVSKGGKQGK